MFWARPISKTSLTSMLRFASKPMRDSNVKYQSLGEVRLRPLSMREIVIFTFLNVVFACVYIGITIYLVQHHILTKAGDLIYSPARHVVSYEKRVVDQSIRTPFHYGPSLKTDAAWHELLQYNNIFVTDFDLKQLNKTSVRLRGQSTYLGGLDVFHELHCLNYVRENVYSDYYAFEDKKFRDEHIFHCIDHLREILMCHGNVAVHTFEWRDEFAFPFMKQQTEHVCRKWEPILQWAKDNYPHAKDGILLEHPTLGIIPSTKWNKTQA